MNQSNLFTIGEFSKITALTVKTLRFYHEERLLIPAFIDAQTGYRYYGSSQIETARIISYLRSLEFPVGEIAQILADKGEGELLESMERHKSDLEQKIKHFRRAVRSLQQFINEERQAKMMAQQSDDVQEKLLQPILIAAIRMKAHYSECGKGFAKIARNFGRYLSGKPMLLHYDTEYKDEADFEAAIPISQRKDVDGISVRELPGGRCVSLLHKGPYDQLGQSYAKILQYVKDRGYEISIPSREVYLKGPGMIFKGNPKNYLTEIQMMIES